MPAYAHSVGPGDGVEIEGILVALAFLVLAFRLRSAPDTKPWVPWTLLSLSLGIGVLSFVAPRITSTAGSSGATVTIVSPEQGARLPANDKVIVDVSIEGGQLASSPTDTDGGHLHIYVDGTVEMLYSTTTDVRLKPGEHEITVEYLDAQHMSYDPPVVSSVSVTAVEED